MLCAIIKRHDLQLYHNNLTHPNNNNSNSTTTNKPKTQLNLLLLIIVATKQDKPSQAEEHLPRLVNNSRTLQQLITMDQTHICLFQTNL